MALYPITVCPFKTERGSEGSHVKTEPELEVLPAQVREHLGLPEAGKDKEGFPQRFQREKSPANTLISDV